MQMILQNESSMSLFLILSAVIMGAFKENGICKYKPYNNIVTDYYRVNKGLGA